MMKQLSTSVDWLNISIHDTEDIQHLLRSEPDFDFRYAKGFTSQTCISLKDKEGLDYLTTLNFNLKSEDGQKKMGNALIQLSSVEPSKVDWISFMRDYRILDKGRVTRLDLALDVDFGTGETAAIEKNKMIQKLVNAVGFNAKTGVVDESKSKLLPGVDPMGKIAKKIQRVTMTASNGVTLYIGSRSSDFMLRVYDKTAEINAKVDEKSQTDSQILRFETELKKELATTVANTILNRFDSLKNVDESVLFDMWNTIVDSRMRFAFRNDTKTLLNYLKIEGDYEMVLFDEVRFDTKKLEKFNWLKNQIAPTLRRYIKDEYDPQTEEDFEMAVLKLMSDLGVVHRDSTNGGR